MDKNHLSIKRLMHMLSIVVFIVGIVFLFNRNNTKNISLLPDIKIPENTEVVLHFSTLTDTTTNFSPDPFSQIYYYDKDGHILGYYELKEEIVNDFIVEGEGNLTFLFKNHTILANQNNYIQKNNSSEIHIESIKFGPSQTGYIKKKNIFYSLLNVGKKEGQEYISVVRFVSNNKNYDIVIPYHLENIAYDEVTQQFICVVSELNDLDEPNSFKYIALYYDDEIDEFKTDYSLYQIPYNQQLYRNNNNFMFRTSMAYNNSIYSAAVIDTQEYIKDTNMNKNRTHGNLLLTKINLDNGSMESFILKENYKLDELGYGVLSGSNHLPMEVINNKLYVFSSDKEVFIIQNENNIETISMPYVFEGCISLKNPHKEEYRDQQNFFGSEVKIGDDGSIYILNLFPKGKLTIHKLLEDSTYQLIWEGRLPENIRSDTFLNAYEIINYTQ